MKPEQAADKVEDKESCKNKAQRECGNRNVTDKMHLKKSKQHTEENGAAI